MIVRETKDSNQPQINAIRSELGKRRQNQLATNNSQLNKTKDQGISAQRQPDILRLISYNQVSQTGATGFDRSFWRPADAMPGYLMQLVKKRREKTIANNNELALAA